MLIEDFIKRSIEQDKRNIFQSTVSNNNLPIPLRRFYEIANPVDVEVIMNGNAIKFIPADELEKSKSEYSLGDERFIFATCNGDPIYIYQDRVYTCYHAINKIEDELIAEKFSLFLSMID